MSEHARAVLTRALEAIGWRAASEEPAEDVAAELALILGESVGGGRDLVRLRRDVADCLRQYAHVLDGSAPAREDWEPAAARIIELFAASE
jgi:hypothetical protein